MRMAPEIFLCSKHYLEAIPALQRVEVDARVLLSFAAECLDYGVMSLREHAKLRIGKLDIGNALAVSCAEHPKPQLCLPVGSTASTRRGDPKGKVAGLVKVERD